MKVTSTVFFGTKIVFLQTRKISKKLTFEKSLIRRCVRIADRKHDSSARIAQLLCRPEWENLTKFFEFWQNAELAGYCSDLKLRIPFGNYMDKEGHSLFHVVHDDILG